MKYEYLIVFLSQHGRNDSTTTRSLITLDKPIESFADINLLENELAIGLGKGYSKTSVTNFILVRSYEEPKEAAK